ncbi:invasion associated locus B family protein [Zavarzinia compransoris]|uniref:Invasion associated locus B family protein n=1 Tax=Zavarzinia compransoris TaxID=1264899 RepID=A0A317DS73_9PROT|nr:invasion associated locus B family protein [Zavarzinia compransoris]PWR17528.1 invasion associated locus B family protein [Zavarzinia compransoris]TDP40359.1 invasion protein IalB [Zavarzinia compransoris]
MMTRLFAGLAALALLAPAAGRAEGEAPDLETSTFGAWTMRCTRQAEVTPPCDMIQAVNNRDTGQTVMQLSFAYLAEQKQYVAQILLPLGFLITGGVLVRIDGAGDITDWPVTRCEQAGCFVEKMVPETVLKPFREKEKGVVVVLDVKGQPQVFPMDLKGFASAMDLMAKRNQEAAPQEKTK